MPYLPCMSSHMGALNQSDLHNTGDRDECSTLWARKRAWLWRWTTLQGKFDQHRRYTAQHWFCSNHSKTYAASVLKNTLLGSHLRVHAVHSTRTVIKQAVEISTRHILPSCSGTDSGSSLSVSIEVIRACQDSWYVANLTQSLRPTFRSCSRTSIVRTFVVFAALACHWFLHSSRVHSATLSKIRCDWVELAIARCWCDASSKIGSSWCTERLVSAEKGLRMVYWKQHTSLD